MAEIMADGRKPKNQRMDQDTKEIEAFGRSLNDLVQTTGWINAKKLLMDKVGDLNRLTSTTLEGKTDEQLGKEMKERIATVNILTEWINDVEGFAEKYSTTSALANKERPEPTVYQSPN